MGLNRFMTFPRHIYPLLAIAPGISEYRVISWFFFFVKIKKKFRVPKIHKHTHHTFSLLLFKKNNQQQTKRRKKVISQLKIVSIGADQESNGRIKITNLQENFSFFSKYSMLRYQRGWRLTKGGLKSLFGIEVGPPPL